MSTNVFNPSDRRDYPDRWPRHRGKELFTEVDSRCSSENEELLSVSHITGITPRSQKNVTMFQSESLVGYKICEEGNIVANTMWTWQGAIGVSQYHGVVSPAYNVYRQKNNAFNPRFLDLLLREPKLVDVYHSISTGIRPSRLRLYPDEFLTIDFPVPPREEQEQIVRFLDWKISLINKLISSCNAEIDDLHELQHQLINNAVCRGLESTELVNGSAASCHIGWVVKRFKECFSLRKGLTITKDDLRKSGVKVISYGQIHSKNNDGLGVNSDLIRFVDKEYLFQVHSIAEQGDFLFADTSEDVDGCGNCVYIDSSDLIMAGYHTIIAHPKCSEISRYHAYLFQSDLWRRQIQKGANGVKVFSITQTMLKNSYILIPSKVEQEEIIRYLDARCGIIKKLISRKKMYLDHLHEMKNSLISDVVTGKIDVRNVVIPEYEYVPDIGSSELADSEMDEEESDNV